MTLHGEILLTHVGISYTERDVHAIFTDHTHDVVGSAIKLPAGSRTAGGILTRPAWTVLLLCKHPSTCPRNRKRDRVDDESDGFIDLGDWRG